MSVAEIGDHIRRFSPGARSFDTIGIPGVTNKSHLSGVLPPDMSVLLLLFDVFHDVGHVRLYMTYVLYSVKWSPGGARP